MNVGIGIKKFIIIGCSVFMAKFSYANFSGLPDGCNLTVLEALNFNELGYSSMVSLAKESTGDLQVFKPLNMMAVFPKNFRLLEDPVDIVFVHPNLPDRVFIGPMAPAVIGHRGRPQFVVQVLDPIVIANVHSWLESRGDKLVTQNFR